MTTLSEGRIFTRLDANFINAKAPLWQNYPAKIDVNYPGFFINGSTAPTRQQCFTITCEAFITS